MIENEKYNNIIINNTIASLRDNNFDAFYLPTKKDILEKLTLLIKKNDIIGFGGSRTLEQIGFFDEFKSEKYPNLINRNVPDLTDEKKRELQLKALSSDIFLCSANAISQSGELVMIDKYGNRNAGITYGPKKRIIIAGMNKITPDLESAIKRTKNKASILNNIRFDTKNPCTVTGKCMDCSSETDFAM